REFESPAFELEGKIISLKVMGQTQTHLRVGLVVNEVWFEAVWFNSCNPNEPMPIAVGDEVKIVYMPKIQTFRGELKLNCQIIHLEKII
ncbi:MAG TPA: hypothetical protein PLD88_10815, partial [Candidatus Berkiella sp.]|nr:hypothetical protein [Candidatus Berkiella sp.]